MHLLRRLWNWWSKSLQRRLISLNVVLMLSFLLLLSLLSLQIGWSGLRREVEQGNRWSAMLVAKDISAHYDVTISTVRLLQRQIETLPGALFAQANAMLEFRLAEPLTYRELYLLDEDERICIGISGSLERLRGIQDVAEFVNPPVRPSGGVLATYEATRDLGDLYVSSAQVTGVDQVPVIFLGLPVARATQECQFLVIVVDLRNTWQKIDKIYVGETGRAFVVSRKGVIIAHPDRAYIGQILPTELAPVLGGYEGQVVYTDPISDQMMLAAYSPVGKQSGWGVVVEQVYAEAVAPVKAIVSAALGVLLAAAAVATVATSLLAQSILGPIRRLEETTQVIADTGDLSRDVAVEGKDEVAHLAATFNRMTTNLRQTEQALIESEERFRRALENIPDVIVIYDADLRIRYINAATRRITGRSESDFIGKREEDIWPPEVYQAYLPILQDAFDTGVTRSVETDLSLPNTGVFNLKITCVPLTDAKGQVREVMGITHDLTESKQTQDEIQRILDRQIAVNQLALTLGDLTDTAEIYHTIYEHVRHLMDTEAFIVSLYDDRERLIHAECVISSQAAHDVSAFPSIPLSEKGQGTQSQVIHTGEPHYVPDYRKAMETAKCEYTIQQDGVIVQGPPPPERREESTNSALYVPMKIEGKTIGVMQVQSHRLDAYDQDDMDLLSALANLAAIAIQNAKLFDNLQQSNEELVEHRERLEELVTQRTVELNHRVAESERLNRAMANLLEDMQSANRNLETMAQKLEFANKELESFAYSVSHDLRAPLRAISGFSRILIEDYTPELSSEIVRYLHLVHEHANEMGQLINDLLAFSRLSRKPLNKQIVAPTDVARRVIESLYKEQKDRQVEITVDDLPACQADPALLKQVLVNLLTNALKFTREQEKALIKIGYQQTDDECIYFVRDNGVGFDMRYANKLFGVFQRLHSDEEYEGTGVGLAIVQRIVRRHGGRIWAEAKVDEGATFYFTLEAKS
ncbi:MAG: PAS domain-containing protein [Chloroflexota bacterium]|nr:PAS domain-containing protein [Chloroflexota bacterium]